MKQKAKPTAFRAEGLAFEVLCKEGKIEAGSSLADGCFRESAAFSGSALFFRISVGASDRLLSGKYPVENQAGTAEERGIRTKGGAENGNGFVAL